MFRMTLWSYTTLTDVAFSLFVQPRMPSQRGPKDLLAPADCSGRCARTTEGECAMAPERKDPMEEGIRSPLPRLRKQLEMEYEGLPQKTIDEVAKRSLDEFAGARVREFVPILAWRRAREHLRRAS